MAFVDALLSSSVVTANYLAASTNYIVETDAGVQYIVYIDGASDVMFTKSTDSGKTWAAPTTIFTGTATQLSIWFDKWSGLAGGLIHCAYTESVTDDVFYRSINTASADALGTQTTIFASTGATVGPSISIARMRGGNLICVGTINDGTTNFAKKSTDAGANWGDIAAVMESAAGDQVIMAPGFASDNNDAMCLFWDASASEISVKFYDDSLDSWSETAFATSMTALASSTAYPNFSMTVDLTNSELIMAAWSAADLLNADLRIFTVSEAAQTELTNVVLNSTDDQGMCAVSLDTTNGDIYVFYCGLSDGSETFVTALNIYYKVSTDDGTTWGSETKLSPGASNKTLLFTNPRMVYLSAEPIVGYYNPGGGDSISCISVMPTIPAVADVESGVTYGINGVQFTGTLAAGGGNANILLGSVIS